MNDTRYPPADVSPDIPDEIHLRDYLAVLTRRWSLVVLCSVAVLAGAGWMQHRKPELYTAEVLLQREAQRSPLDAFTVGLGPGAPTEAVLSQLEILRSRAVLAAVVDSLGLRLGLDGRRVRRSDMLAGVEIAREAPASTYLLASQGAEVVLTEGRSGAVVARAGTEEWLEGPGLRLLVAPAAPLEEPVQLTVIHEEEATKGLRDAVKATQVRGTSLIRVKYTSPDPVLAAGVLNGLAASYQRYAALRGREAATRRREFIAGQLAKVADSLAAAQQVLSDYQEQSRTLDPHIEGTALAQALMGAETELRTLRFQEGLLESLIVSLRSGRTGDQGFQRIVALGSDLLPAGAEMYRRLQELEGERRRLTASRYGYTEGGHGVEVIDSLIAAMRQDIRGVADESLRVLRSRRQATEARVRDVRAEVGDLPGRATAFGRLQQRVDAVQNIFNILVEKYHEAQIAEAVEAGDVEVVDAATVPAVPDAPRTGRNLLLALVLGLMLGVGLAFFVEYLDTSVRAPEDAERAAGLQLLGIVPKLPVSADGAGLPVVLRAAEHVPGAEAFRVLRTTLRFVREKRPRVVAVASPGLGEGKTTIAINLALAHAQDGSRVLLVDADLRRPAAHRVFGLDRTPGLSDVLVGEAAATDAIRGELGEPGLSLLPCGTTVPHPAELLGGEVFAGLLDYARENFDVVVIDTPPILAAADAAVIGSAVDGVLVVAKANETDRTALAHAADQMRQVKASLLGIVLNEVPLTGPYKRYGYYYYYHYYGDDSGKKGGVRQRILRSLRRGSAWAVLRRGGGRDRRDHEVAGPG